MEGDFGSDSIQTMVVVLIGGYLTAGGANAINMWYDRDIDPKMLRTSDTVSYTHLTLPTS